VQIPIRRLCRPKAEDREGARRLDVEKVKGREGSRVESERAVGMKTREENPEYAAREGCDCKMKKRMQQLLHGVQCCSILHFADAHPDDDSDGDGITPSKIFICLPHMCDYDFILVISYNIIRPYI
jgi:hypothetical protein